ncbi:TPA: hypothetical protein ACNHQ5_004366 [Escherichia coli]
MITVAQILSQHAAQVAAAERSAHLLARIKIEARWLLLTAPARSFAIDDQHYAADRRALVAAWPDIRHRRMSSAAPASFYDAVADQASRLVGLIEVRRQRRSAAQ